MAVTPEEMRALRELMRFRYFKRYDFEFDYDWDRLLFLRKKLETARQTIPDEPATFAGATENTRIGED